MIFLEAQQAPGGEKHTEQGLYVWHTGSIVAQALCGGQETTVSAPALLSILYGTLGLTLLIQK